MNVLGMICLLFVLQAHGEGMTKLIQSEMVKAPSDTVKIFEIIAVRNEPKMSISELKYLQSIANPRSATDSLFIVKDIANNYKQFGVSYQEMAEVVREFYFHHEEIYGELPYKTYLEVCSNLKNIAHKVTIDYLIVSLVVKIGKSKDPEAIKDIVDILKFEDPRNSVYLLSALAGSLDKEKSLNIIIQFKDVYEKTNVIENELNRMIHNINNPDDQNRPYGYVN